MAPAFIFIHPHPQPLQHPKKATWQEMKVTGGSHPHPLYLCRFQLSSSADTNIHCSPCTVPPQAARGYQAEHKPHSTRASPGLHFARHKHFMGISGVSNPSCSVGSVTSLLSTHTPTSRQGLGGKLIYSLFILLSSILTAITSL